MPAIITGWGHCAPPGILTNDDLSTIMDTSDEWIVERTGIRQRHCSHVSSGELGRVAGSPGDRLRGPRTVAISTPSSSPVSARNC